MRASHCAWGKELAGVDERRNGVALDAALVVLGLTRTDGATKFVHDQVFIADGAGSLRPGVPVDLGLAGAFHCGLLGQGEIVDELPVGLLDEAEQAVPLAVLHPEEEGVRTEFFGPVDGGGDFDATEIALVLQLDGHRLTSRLVK